ncbi:TRAP transporter large permease [Paenirhodobacter populi]|uniref:TRAP transporter large permease protein n=1 Tax=Paenirhodobacter populi TaxID=2306993 RepID=A0A443K576_9RHOB|nr:TRAP transporter large permease [Sinirhodobacter populi]RWR07222.1 TRAP transporter large permease [Sinirhodobacter populi]RWR07398.1 TRAP transporter large permease [Sinirhodobacter populi]RWR27875.1 TRAP transporter large permease [Sinirhodobacter populi]
MIAVTLIVLFSLLLLSVPVAAVLGLSAVVLSELFAFIPATRGIGTVTWQSMNDGLLIAVPLFVLMGELLLRSGVASRMYNALSGWLGWLPGGLMHANIGTSTLFAATSGSSVATAATVATTAIPEIKRHNYNEPLFLGSIAASGTLGILIPPSINLIIFGALTNTSIPALYLAGFIPGLGLAVLFSMAVLIACKIRPEWGGERISATWQERIGGLPHLLPPLFIFFLVVGTIYAGWATPTEAAALGVLGAIIVAAFARALTLSAIRAAFFGTIRTTGMLIAIVSAAYFLNFVFGNIGLTSSVTDAFQNLSLSPYGTLFLVIAFYLVLGLFLETLSLMVATVSIFTPVLVSQGFDPVWFGILVILLIETAMITPPVGINLFVVQGVRGRGSLNDVVRGVVPFLGSLFVGIILIILFPKIVLFLPDILR